MANIELQNVTARTPQSGDKVWGTSSAETTAYEFAVDDLHLLAADVDNTNLTTGVRFLTYADLGNATDVSTASQMKLHLAYVPACTPSSLTIEVTAAAASSDRYLAIYNIDPDSGLPTTLAASWGPFDTSSVAKVTLTSQTETLDSSGLYWVGTCGAGGNVTLRHFPGGNQPQLFGTTTVTNTLGGIYALSVGSTPPADVSATTWESGAAGGVIRVEVA